MSVSLSLTQGSKRHWRVWNLGSRVVDVEAFEDPQHRVAPFRDPIVGLSRPPRDGQRTYEPAPAGRLSISS